LLLFRLLRPNVAAEPLDAPRVGAGLRRPVTTMVDGEDAGAVGEVPQLVVPRLGRQRDAVEQHEGTGVDRPPLDDVQAAAVAQGDVVVDGVLRRAEPGEGGPVESTTCPPDEDLLGGDRGGRATGDEGDGAQLHRSSTSTRGTRGPMPQMIS
jgi:hypothetical protein